LIVIPVAATGGGKLYGTFKVKVNPESLEVAVKFALVAPPCTVAARVRETTVPVGTGAVGRPDVLVVSSTVQVVVVPAGNTDPEGVGASTKVPVAPGAIPDGISDLLAKLMDDYPVRSLLQNVQNLVEFRLNQVVPLHQKIVLR
jgi:hypothetical protein